MKNSLGRQFSSPGHQHAEEVKDAAVSDDGLLHFQVQGQHGPMTLTFKALGKHAYAGSDITAEQAKQLTLEEVQEWYTKNGWPKRGNMRTTVRNHYCGLFELV